MIFQKTIINNRIWDQISKAFKKNKIPNAYIFSGSDGTGKELHALEFSALLNCKRLNDLSSCGECRSCFKIKMFQHEELHFIYPVKLLKNSSTNDYAMDSKTNDSIINQYRIKSKNPYYKITLKKSNTISINSIRNIKKQLFLSKSDENWSVVIINDAEKLCKPNVEAANSLLKILEEPPPRTIFFLITSKSSQIIPTIRSRCQHINFPDIPLSDIKKYIYDNNIKDISDEHIQLCNGSLREIAIDLNDDLNSFKNIFQSFYSNKTEDLSELIIAFEKNHKSNKKFILRQINYLIISVKDLLLLSIDNKSEVQYKFLYQNYLKIISNYSNADWNQIYHLLNESIESLRNNTNLSLELYYLLFNVRYCLSGNKHYRFRSKLINYINV